MANLNSIVTVNISLQTAGVKQEGFGIPLIADFHTRFAERIRFYSGTDAMLTDGFTVNDAAYKAASACFAQTPQPKLVAVGRRANAPVLKAALTPIAANTTVYSVEVTGPTGVTGTASFTSDGTATVAEITAGLKIAIDALATGLTTTDATTRLDITAAAAGLWFGVKVLDMSRIDVKQTHVDAGIAADLAAIKLVNSTWYGVGMTTSSAAEVAALATWVEANKKQCLQDSQDTDIVGAGTGDIATTLKTANQFRTSIEFHDDPRKFAAFGLFGSVFPSDPGSITFKFRRPAGIPSVPLTDTQITNLKFKNANSFCDFGGVTIHFEGKAASGEFCDVIRDRDWFESRMQTRVYTAMLNAKKIPFTDPGIAAIEGQIRAQMVEGVTSGFLAASPEWIVTAPLARDVSPADKAARNLTGLSFQGTIAGAVHATTITGTITL